MARVTLLSAKGSPGVTTLTVALTMAWSSANPARSAIAVDADPAGGDTASGVLRGSATSPAGMLPIATSRGAEALTAIEDAAVPLRPDGTARLLPGVPDEARSAALPLAWDVISRALPDLHDSGTDLLVDAGRVGRAGLGAPWVADCEIALLVVRPTLPAVMAAHRFGAEWSAQVPLHLVVVDAPSPYRPSEVAEAVEVPLLGVVAFDSTSARVHSEGMRAARGFERTSYARDVVRMAREVGALAGDRWSLLTNEGTARVTR